MHKREWKVAWALLSVKSVKTNASILFFKQFDTSCNARNFEWKFDNTLYMGIHIENMYKSMNFQMRYITLICKLCAGYTAATFVHALLKSCLDYGNATFYGITESQLNKLQLLQNTYTVGLKMIIHIIRFTTSLLVNYWTLHPFQTSPSHMKSSENLLHNIARFCTCRGELINVFPYISQDLLINVFFMFPKHFLIWRPRFLFFCT